MTSRLLWSVLSAAAITAGTTAGSGRAAIQPELADRVMKLTRDSSWRLVSSIPLSFRTFHPQGMVKIGDHFIVSSVEVRVPTRRLPQIVDGHDRDTGEGAGHLFKIDATGKLVADVTVGEGTVYHPGGIDYDGTNVWVPVAEYRPNSRSIIYRVDPVTMTVTRVFAFDDHIGAIVHATDDRTLHGVSWGSRYFYRWTLDAGDRVTNTAAARDRLRTVNPSHYVDYQDCKYAGAQRMLCTGVTEISRATDASPFRLGGIDLIDLRDGRPLHQVPLLLWTATGLDMTHNPAWLEATPTGIRGYFMPEDDVSKLYIYEVTP